jgi:hypothetical protein
MINVYQTPPAAIGAPREEVNFSVVNNCIHFITSNGVNHNLFSNVQFCYLLQFERHIDFVNNLFSSGGSDDNSNETHII